MKPLRLSVDTSHAGEFRDNISEIIMPILTQKRYGTYHVIFPRSQLVIECFVDAA